jgi:hypothetical protein
LTQTVSFAIKRRVDCTPWRGPRSSESAEIDRRRRRRRGSRGSKLGLGFVP